jgi:hypothetical protein
VRPGPVAAVPGDRRSLSSPTRRATFSAAPGSATRASENLTQQQHPWAGFSGTPACRRVRRLSRLRSGSPPCGGEWRPSSSDDVGHLRPSRRPARWLWRPFPSRASRGLPPLRMCPREIEAPEAHSQGVARPTVAPFLVHSGARDSRALRSTRMGAAGAWCVRGPWLRSQAAAGRFPARRVARRFQRRLAPPRALRRTSSDSSAPIPVFAQRVVVLRVGLVRDRHRGRWPCPVSVTVTGPALFTDHNSTHVISTESASGDIPHSKRGALLTPCNPDAGPDAGPDVAVVAGPDAAAVAGTRFSDHRPAVAFGARRASVPAHRPAVARGVCPARVISATSGRLDGLLACCCALLRHAIPGGAPHGIVPIETRTLAAQYRVLHARRCAKSRAQRGT